MTGVIGLTGAAAGGLGAGFPAGLAPSESANADQGSCGVGSDIVISRVTWRTRDGAFRRSNATGDLTHHGRPQDTTNGVAVAVGRGRIPCRACRPRTGPAFKGPRMSHTTSRRRGTDSRAAAGGVHAPATGPTVPGCGSCCRCRPRQTEACRGWPGCDGRGRLGSRPG